MPDTHLHTRTGRDKIRAVIRWANAAGFPNIAVELSNALLLIPEAEALERLLATPAESTKKFDASRGFASGSAAKQLDRCRDPRSPTCSENLALHRA